MKKLVAAALVVAFTLSAASPAAEAGKRRSRYRKSWPAASRRSSGGVFSGIMELERRKNAWLRATFFGS